MSATETSTANEAAHPDTPSLFSRLRRFLTGGKSRTSEPSVIQEKKPTEAETATEEVVPPSPPETSPEDTSSAEPDTIIFAPRRPDSPQRHNLDEILKNLTHKEFPDRTALYSVDGEPAFPTDSTVSKWWMAPARMTKRSGCPCCGHQLLWRRYRADRQ